MCTKSSNESHDSEELATNYSVEIGLKPTPEITDQQRKECFSSLLYAIKSRKMTYTENLVFLAIRVNSLLAIDLEL